MYDLHFGDEVCTYVGNLEFAIGVAIRLTLVKTSPFYKFKGAVLIMKAAPYSEEMNTVLNLLRSV